MKNERSIRIGGKAFSTYRQHSVEMPLTFSVLYLLGTRKFPNHEVVEILFATSNYPSFPVVLPANKKKTKLYIIDLISRYALCHHIIIIIIMLKMLSFTLESYVIGSVARIYS